jgi:inorganic pyrophosphatase
MDLSKIESGDEKELNVIIEIPKGSQNKYEFDKDKGIITLDRVLFSPLHYPGDYGFVPHTLAPDGDPLDALVLVSLRTFPGCLIRAKPIGILRLIDSGKEDSKILCVPVKDPRLSHYKNIDSISTHVRQEIAHFFLVYKQLEGRKVKILGWKGVAEAKKAIKDAIKRYKTTA